MKQNPKHKKGKPLNDEPSDLAAGFKAMNEHRKEVNSTNLASNKYRVRGACEVLGIRCVDLTDYHCRIECDTHPPLDIYPTSGKYHNHKTGKRGVIRGSYTDFLRLELKGILPELQAYKRRMDNLGKGIQ